MTLLYLPAYVNSLSSLTILAYSILINKTEGAKILNDELSKIAEWLAANKLSLNVKKSQLLIFTNQHIPKATKQSSNIDDPSSATELNDGVVIHINGEVLKEVDHAKYLGVLIDNKLDWSYQISAVNLKLSKGIGLLAKIRHFVPTNTLRSLYFSFVNPYTDYNLLNWGMAASTNLNSINLKLKKAVRIMSFKDSDEHAAPLFKELEILPLDKSIELNNGKFMWKLYNGFLPASLAKNFNLNTRNQISNSLSRLESLKKFILFAGPLQWRELPSSIREKTSLKSFSNALKSYLLDPDKFHSNISRNNLNKNRINQNNSNNQNIQVLRRAGNNYGRLADNWSGVGLVSRWDK